MTIEVHGNGALAEVIVTDFEDEDRVARSGYLTADERLVLADKLRAAAEELEGFE